MLNAHSRAAGYFLPLPESSRTASRACFVGSCVCGDTNSRNCFSIGGVLKSAKVRNGCSRLARGEVVPLTAVSEKVPEILDSSITTRVGILHCARDYLPHKVGRVQLRHFLGNTLSHYTRLKLLYQGSYGKRRSKSCSGCCAVVAIMPKLSINPPSSRPA